MSTREQSCEERIAAQMGGREDDFGKLLDATDGTQVEYDGEDIGSDEAYDTLSEYPLGVSVKRVMRVDLSTGGPGDWIEADLDEDGEVDAVTYHFNDWFDHAERRVAQDSPLWRAAEYYAEYVR